MSQKPLTSTAIDRPRFACVIHGLHPTCKCKLYDLSLEADRINCAYARRRSRSRRTSVFLLGPPLSLFIAGGVVALAYGFSPGALLFGGSTFAIIAAAAGGIVEHYTRSKASKTLDVHLNQIE